MSKGKYIAPDGGWGWVIVVAFALNNIVMIPILQGFGMIYGSAFKRLGVSATQATIIININQAFGMILGMMNGPLLRKYNYRKMAIVGSLLYSSGVILTSFASSFIHFVITYGMMTSVGMSIGMSSFSLALNTYFKEKRGRAMGWAMTITGLGPIIIPHLTSLLLSHYGNEGTMFILGGLSLNSLVGALLLQPIKWHAKPVVETQEYVENEDEKDALKEESIKNCDTEESVTLLGGSTEKSICNVENDNKNRVRKRSRTMTISSADFNDDNISIYGFETPISMQNGSLLDLRDYGVDEEELNLKNKEDKKFQRQSSVGNSECDYKRSNSFNEMKARKFSVGSRYGDLSLTKEVLAECPEEDGEFTKSSNDDNVKNGTCTPLAIQLSKPVYSPSLHTLLPQETLPQRPRSQFMRLMHAIANFFDLGLLRDPIYVNIMLGMSIAIFAEFNFSVLTPFILQDKHLDEPHQAVMMSTLATADLVLRALAPYIGEWLRKPPRSMYLVSLFLLILTRTALIFSKKFSTMLIVSVGLGIAKGVRTVYMTLVIPSHVPLEKLANASSIQSLVNGFFLMSVGPFLGVIRDKTGSYDLCIAFINFVTAITIVMWLSEFTISCIVKRRRKRDGVSTKLGPGVINNIESR